MNDVSLQTDGGQALNAGLVALRYSLSLIDILQVPYK